MERRRETEQVKSGVSPMVFGKCLLLSYVITGILLLIMTFLLYKLELSAGMVSLGVVLIYVLASFCGGIVMGKHVGSKKYIWGLLIGVAYFIILLILSFGVNYSLGEVTRDVLTTLMICAGSGMIGGMLS